jgi:glyceraldehyde-3-phosphate dehydrogenase (ferredoxin)
MDSTQKVLFIDPASGFYRTRRYAVGDFFGPVDLGLHLSGRSMSINIGTGLFAGSILPGSNRLIVTGFSPCWRGFYISSMGGAGLVFDNLGVNMISIAGKAPVPSVICLNRTHGEEIEVLVEPCDLASIWRGGGAGDRAARGAYALMEYCLDRYGSRYEDDPRILSTGPASLSTDFGGILSAPISKGVISPVDTWAGRGGMGSKLLQEHGIAAIIYGGTFLDEDFRDRKVADQWFIDKYQQRLMAKDLESTTKYRFDPKFQTGGTFGVNFAGMGGRIMAFNYRTIYDTEEQRRSLHKEFVLDHYLPQFNEETIVPRHQATCGEPCSAVCKKMRGIYKKDYEPYQAFGPLCGIFDQRGAERAVRRADELGFDSISAGGVAAWRMDLMDTGILSADELGVTGTPKFSAEGFTVVSDSTRTRISRSPFSSRSSRGGGSSICGKEPVNGGGESPGRRGGTSSTPSSTQPSDGRAGWFRTSTGHRAPWRRWALWGSTTCTTAWISCRPAGSETRARQGSSASSSWTTRGSAGSTARGPRR